MRMLAMMLCVISVMIVINLVLYITGAPQWISVVLSVPVGLVIGSMDIWQD